MSLFYIFNNIWFWKLTVSDSSSICSKITLEKLFLYFIVSKENIVFKSVNLIIKSLILINCFFKNIYFLYLITNNKHAFAHIKYFYSYFISYKKFVQVIYKITVFVHILCQIMLIIILLTNFINLSLHNFK